MFEYARATLPNGIRLLVAPMAHVRSVTVDCYFGVGSRYESEALSGVSHFIEHMLFKGTERYPTAQAISETIEGVGGLLDAATDKEVTVYTVKIASRHFDLAMELLSDMVRRPLFEASEMEKERHVIIEELGMYRDSPADWVGVMADETLWPASPLGREVAGTRETVSALTREALREYKETHYTPGNMVISMAGDINMDQARTAVTRLLGDWAPGDAPRWTPDPPPAGVARVRLEKRKTQQTNFCLMVPGLAHEDPDYYTLAMLNAVLGDGMSSRLFQRVREELGLAYEINSGPASYHDTGSYTIFAGVEPARATAAIEAILAELKRLRDERVDEAELARAREYTKGRMTLRLEDTRSVAGWLGGQEILLNKVYDLDDVLGQIDAVTAEGIQRLAGRLFQEEWLRLALIGPHKDAAEFERALTL